MDSTSKVINEKDSKLYKVELNKGKIMRENVTEYLVITNWNIHVWREEFKEQIKW